MAKTQAPPAPKPHRAAPPFNAAGKRPNQFAREMLERSTSQSNKQLLGAINKIEAEYRDEDRWRNIDPIRRAEWLDSQIADLQRDHYGRKIADYEVSMQALQKFADVWRKTNKSNGADDNYALTRHRIEVALLSKRELAQELEKASAASSHEERAAIDHNRLLAIAERSLNDGDNTSAGIAKAALEKSNAGEPWLNSEQGSNLQSRVDHDSVEFGLAKVENAGDFDTIEITTLLNI